MIRRIILLLMVLAWSPPVFAQIVTPGGGGNVTQSGGVTGGTCTGGQFVNAINTSGVPTCASPGGSVPAGAPPQIIGYSATNTGEAETLGGDATMTRTGANAYSITVTKSNGTAFTLATAAIPLSIANGGRGSIAAPSVGQIDVASSTTAFTPVTMSADCTITSAGAITCTKTSGTAFSALATAAVPLSIANGGRGSSTAPSIGQIDVASATTAFTPVTMSNDCTITSAGAITCTKTGGVAFTAFATAAVPLSIANGGRGSTTAPTAGQIDVAQSGTAFGAVTMSGDATITSAGAITVTKTSGTAFSALATAAVPLSIANGGNGSSTAPTTGQIEVATSSTAYAPVTMSNDCTITSAGAITCTKTNGTAFGTLATQSSSAVSFFFAGTPAASSIVTFACPFSMTVPTNFASPNSTAVCATNPAESDAYTVKINGVSLGTITLSTSCVPTLGTATTTTCSAGQKMEVDAPATVSGTNVSIVVAVNR